MKWKSKILTVCLSVCCALMGLTLVGVYASGKDTRLPIVGSAPPNITNHYHVNQTPDNVTYVPTNSQPQTVVFQASSEPVQQQKITYIEQPRPDRTEDTTIVVYKPEVRQPVQKVIVVDERYERLKAEHEQRMREWHSNTVVIK